MEKMYISTVGCAVHPITFQTNYGPIQFNVWNVAGLKKFSGLRNGHYICGKCEIIIEPFLLLAKELIGNEDLIFMKDNELEKPVEIDLNSLNNVKSGTEDLSNPSSDDED
ncbi:GTP-binding nuclear protein Ran [Entamoeba marina]